MGTAEKKILVPHTAGPALKNMVSPAYLDCEGQFVMLPVEGKKEAQDCIMYMHPPRDEPPVKISNFYELEMYIISNGLLCREHAEGEDGEGFTSPSSWKWSSLVEGHKKIMVQKFCDIDGHIWVLKKGVNN